MIADLWSSTNMTPLPVHILGHQDMVGQPLNRLDQLNTMMDWLEKLMVSHVPSKGCSLFIPPSLGMPHVKYHENYITGKLHQKLFFSLTADLVLDRYYHQVLLMSLDNTKVLAYQALETAHLSVPTHINIFISKWLSNTLPTGLVMQQCKQCLFN
jgi:hypothetical protein